MWELGKLPIYTMLILVSGIALLVLVLFQSSDSVLELYTRSLLGSLCVIATLYARFERDDEIYQNTLAQFENKYKDPQINDDAVLTRRNNHRESLQQSQAVINQCLQNTDPRILIENLFTNFPNLAQVLLATPIEIPADIVTNPDGSRNLLRVVLVGDIARWLRTRRTELLMEQDDAEI